MRNVAVGAPIFEQEAGRNKKSETLHHQILLGQFIGFKSAQQ
jgi:hypothetical protein